MKNDTFSKSIKKYERLGAKQMQKFVLAIENAKWKVSKKFGNKFLNVGLKVIDREKEKRLKKAKTEEEQKEIKDIAINQKMELKKEYNSNKNINYHLSNDVDKTLQHFERNKYLHERGLKADSIKMALSGATAILGYTSVLPHDIVKVAIPAMVLYAGGTFINYQCINLQKYNIDRIKRNYDKVVEREEKKREENIKNYGDAYKLIGSTLEEKGDLVDYEEIINNSKSTEELIQLRALVTKAQEKRKKENQKEIEKQKVKTNRR